VTSYFIRPFRESDIEQMRWLHQRTPPAGKVALRPQSWRPELDDITANFDGFWVAVEPAGTEDAIVGMVGVEQVGTREDMVPLPASLASDGRTTRLHAMRVAPERQRRGIGRMLAQTAIEWARDQGYESMILETTREQQAALALYESVGFKEIGRSRFREYELVWFRLVL
jgi:ribosomal protein S18 acetylase RimI-like enzyme